jgi:hypothetical protein
VRNAARNRRRRHHRERGAIDEDQPLQEREGVERHGHHGGRCRGTRDLPPARSPWLATSSGMFNLLPKAAHAEPTAATGPDR